LRKGGKRSHDGGENSYASDDAKADLVRCCDRKGKTSMMSISPEGSGGPKTTEADIGVKCKYTGGNDFTAVTQRVSGVQEYKTEPTPGSGNSDPR